MKPEIEEYLRECCITITGDIQDIDLTDTELERILRTHDVKSVVIVESNTSPRCTTIFNNFHTERERYTDPKRIVWEGDVQDIIRAKNLLVCPYLSKGSKPYTLRRFIIRELILRHDLIVDDLKRANIEPYPTNS